MWIVGEENRKKTERGEKTRENAGRDGEENRKTKVNIICRNWEMNMKRMIEEKKRKKGEENRKEEMA